MFNSGFAVQAAAAAVGTIFGLPGRSGENTLSGNHLPQLFWQVL